MTIGKTEIIESKNKFHQGKYYPKNKSKFVSNLTYCIFRSSWEISIMRFFDENKNILAWSSESLKINYMCPTTKRWRSYYPDFMVKYKKNNIEVTELIEVKPRSQTYKQFAKSKKDKEALLLNEAKWKYARAWCDKNNITFRILTEKEIYL